MAYNPPYYPALLEGCGLAKAHDLLAYRLTVPAETPPRLAAALSRVEGAGVRLRSVDLRRFDDEVANIHRVHSAAWAENWGAVPLSVEEMRQLARDLLPVVDPELVLLAEVAGEPVGVSVTVPDLNLALRHLHGRLLPFGWARLAWQRRQIDAVRVLILGVLAPWRHRGIDAALYARMLAVARRKGYAWGELSWILESNGPMRRALAGLGAECYKTYRIYEGDA
jgi:GNAT superfamily N-acetyltransferase